MLYGPDDKPIQRATAMEEINRLTVEVILPGIIDSLMKPGFLDTVCNRVLDAEGKRRFSPYLGHRL